MGWRFRKSFKILPGVRLNIGKTGITGATVGKRGFTTSIGKRGFHQNLGIPGTGLSYRSKVGEGLSSIGGPIVGLGIVAGLLLGVIALCAVLGSIGRNTGQPNTPAPARLITNNPAPPTPRPTISANRKTTPSTKKKSKLSPAQSIPLATLPPERSSRYIRGPRGGCYYINSRGNKTYVDRGLCG